MKVVAIKPAFYRGRRVRVGDELDIPENEKGSWFVAAAARKPLAETYVEQPRALSEMHNVARKTFTDAMVEQVKPAKAPRSKKAVEPAKTDSEFA